MKNLISILVGVLLFCNIIAVCEEQLYISEVMASNDVTLKDAFGKYSDWIEIYNPSDVAVSLKGVCLSDDKNEPLKYTFPENAVLEAGEYTIVFASGLSKDIIIDEYHANFKLKAIGEAIYLSKDGQILDSVLFYDQKNDVSWQRLEDDTYSYCEQPTPTIGIE